MAQFVEINGTRLDVDHVVAWQRRPAGRDGMFLLVAVLNTPAHTRTVGNASVSVMPEMEFGPFTSDEADKHLAVLTSSAANRGALEEAVRNAVLSKTIGESRYFVHGLAELLGIHLDPFLYPLGKPPRGMS